MQGHSLKTMVLVSIKSNQIVSGKNCGLSLGLKSLVLVSHTYSLAICSLNFSQCFSFRRRFCTDQLRSVALSPFRHFEANNCHVLDLCLKFNVLGLDKCGCVSCFSFVILLFVLVNCYFKCNQNSIIKFQKIII